MGMVMKDKNRGYIKLSDSFLESIKITNDPEKLRKYTLFFHNILERNLPKSADSNGLLENIRITKGLLVEDLNETDDPEYLRKLMRMVYRVLKDNLAIKDESEIDSKLIRRICRDDFFDNYIQEGEHNSEL